MLIRRGARWFRRRRAARRLGLDYGRAATFRIPHEIRVGDRWIKLNIPSESGQHTAFVELLLDDCYALRWIAARSTISNIIDIGANIGLFAIASRRMFPRALVHAYEPNARLVPMLAAHAEAMGFDYFTEAVGVEGGAVSLLVDPLQSVMTKTHLDPEGAVRQIALREALARIGGHADLVKLDCEGAEWQLFQDVPSWQNVDRITMEYHLDDGDRHDRIVEALREIGFKTIRHRPATPHSFGLALAVRR